MSSLLTYNAPCHISAWGVSHKRMSHATHVNTPCDEHTYVMAHVHECITSHVSMRHVTHLNGNLVLGARLKEKEEDQKSREPCTHSKEPCQRALYTPNKAIHTLSSCVAYEHTYMSLWVHESRTQPFIHSKELPATEPCIHSNEPSSRRRKRSNSHELMLWVTDSCIWFTDSCIWVSYQYTFT